MSIFESKGAIEACFSHARDLLRAAKRVLDDEKLPNIAFHLATLALEEIGKASLLGSRDVVRAYDGDTTFADNRLDDHVFKLFWAFWTPAFGRGTLTREEWEASRGLAKQIHEDRLAALYVSSEVEAATPLQFVGEERAQWLISLSEARLGMEGTRDWAEIDFTTNSNNRWFLDSSSDPEMRKMIFGGASFEKLGELQNIREWIAWLRQEFEKADAQAAEHLRTELARAVPDRHDLGDEKWKIRVRLHSPAQSVRTKALKVWNQWPIWIKLYAVDKHPHQLDVEFAFREAVSLQALGAFSYHTARLFLAALNIASLGLWWWRATDHYSQFYERITDLKADPSATPVELVIRGDPKIQWERKALKEPDLGRIGLCFGMIAKLDPDQRTRIIEPYLAGLGLLAKSDAYFNMSASACERFTKAVLEAMQHFGDWDGSDGALQDAISGAFPQMPENDRKEWLEIIQQLRVFPPRSEGMTIERAALLKILADAYLINSFTKRAKDESWVVADKE